MKKNCFVKTNDKIHKFNNNQSNAICGTKFEKTDKEISCMYISLYIKCKKCFTINDLYP